MEKGAFVLSLDTEMAWGCCDDKSKIQKNTPYYLKARDCIEAIIELLEKHNISATWAIVGHLFLSNCTPVDGIVHPEILRPFDADGDWFASDPCSDIEHDPIWYGKDIVDAIRDCPVPQEIGCHTFSHIVVDPGRCGKTFLDSDLKLCRKLAGDIGIDLKSLVFPRNVVNYLDIVADNGFIAFRGEESYWYKRFLGLIGKIAVRADSLLFFVSPPVCTPEKKSCWEIKGSYFYGHSSGISRMLPISFRVAKAKSGIRQAARDKKVFHLWFHPFNIATNAEVLLSGLDDIFGFVARLRSEGKIDSLTMRELAERSEMEKCAFETVLRAHSPDRSGSRLLQKSRPSVSGQA